MLLVALCWGAVRSCHAGNDAVGGFVLGLQCAATIDLSLLLAHHQDLLMAVTAVSVRAGNKREVLQVRSHAQDRVSPIILPLGT
jgi:hypothetical protein